MSNKRRLPLVSPRHRLRFLTVYQIEVLAPLGISHTIDDAGIAEVVMDNPPVNALTVAGWFELADTITALGDDPNVRVVVLRAEGRGFNAGVDIKEMQADRGLRRTDRREPGLLRRLRGGLRLQGAGDRGGATATASAAASGSSATPT